MNTHSEEESFVYDKAKWHYEGEFPEELDEYHGYIHTGMYLAWAIETGLTNEEFAEEFAEEIEQFQARAMTGPQIYEAGDGVFDSTMLTSQGNSFTRVYFDFDTGDYANDYIGLLAENLPTLYHVADSWANYDTLKVKITQRYQAWLSSQPSPRGSEQN
jgi:hypothetical protein